MTNSNEKKNSTNNIEQEQLIPLSIISTKEKLADIDRIIKNDVPSNLQQQTFLLRLFSFIINVLKSIHLPHISDNILRIIFLLFITFIGLTSFTIGLIVGFSFVQFKQQCPLYASFQFQIVLTIENNWTIKLIPLSERFSSQSTCDFCTFYNVFTFIYCVITCFFFILFNGDQRIITTNDRCLVIPWFPITVILGLFSLINASILTNGFLKFCSTIISNDNRITSCIQINQLFFEQYPNVKHFFNYMLLAIIASWGQLAFFIGIIAVLTIRLVSSSE